MKTSTFSDQVANFILGRNLEQLKELTLQEVTAYFEVSKVYLIKKFKAEKGITPGKFILREKMIRANSLLEQNQDLTVKSISEMAGYSTPDYFIRVFKNQMGLAPCQYRNIKREAARDNNQKFIKSEKKKKTQKKYNRV